MSYDKRTSGQRDYSILVIDPPWKFASNSAAKPARNAMRHYPCMTDAEIASIPVEQIAAKHALLFLWVTVPILDRAMAIPPLWGFRYISSFVWPKGRIATGYWIRNQHELCLLYKRGRFPRPDAKAPFKTSLISGAVREHSRKPEHLQDEIDRIWPSARKLEMFARQTRLGWDVVGNEIERFNR